MTKRICPECETRSKGALCPKCGTRTLFDAPSDAGIDPLIGKVFDGRYRIESLLGQGGMGAVYKAVQTAMNKTVAVKVVKAELATNVEAARRFHGEAKAASRLSQPHSIRVFDFGQSQDRALFMVMEYVEGRTLSQLIRDEKRIPPGRAAKIGAEITQTLIEAHGHGLVHRDLKPDNVLLMEVPGDPEFVKVLDFGIAKFLTESSGDSALTRTGAVIGTPQYMAPEQARATRHLTPAVDIYALGVVLYHMLNGDLPFRGETPVEILMAHAQEPVPELPDDLELPDAMRALVKRMLGKQPSKRPDGQETFDALEEIRLEEIMRRGRASAKPAPRTESTEDLRARRPTEEQVSEEEAPEQEVRPTGTDLDDAIPHPPEPVATPGPSKQDVDATEGPVCEDEPADGPIEATPAVDEEDYQPSHSLEMASLATRSRSRNSLFWIIAAVSLALATGIVLAQQCGSGSLPVDLGVSPAEDTREGEEVEPSSIADTLPESLAEIAATDIHGEGGGPPGTVDAVETVGRVGAKEPTTKPPPSPNGVRVNVTSKPSSAIAHGVPNKTRPRKPGEPIKKADRGPPKPPPMVSVRFVSTPFPGAEVFQGNKRLGKTEFTLRFREDAGRLTFKCQQTGYKDTIVSIDVGQKRKVSCSMVKLF